MVQQWSRESIFARSTFRDSNETRPLTASAADNRKFFPTRPLHPQLSSHSFHPQDPSRPTVPAFALPVIDYHVPHLTQTPWELERSRRNSLWRRSKPAPMFPAAVFKNLPREVYDAIIAQLELLRVAHDYRCPSCYLKDLYSLSLTSRAWDRAATAVMYSRVWVSTNEEHPKLPKLKIKGAARLKLLRRTLRERRGLSALVRELHLSEFQWLYQSASIDREEIVNLVASLVYACPNLERIVGFHAPYSPSFDRLSQALSTRKNMKERIWVLSGVDDDESDEEEDITQHYYHAACDPTERFLELNSQYRKLTTLVLHQGQLRPDISPTFRAIVGTCRQLPALRHLTLSGLPAATFSNLALNSLPPYLESLRLENLPGISDKGLVRLSTSSSRLSLQNLSLINLEIANLTTISGILCERFPQLRNFTFSQYRSLYLPSNLELPFLRSKTVSYIHWEIRSQASPLPTNLPSITSRETLPQFPFGNAEPLCCLATSLLAASIRNGLFPSLRNIRIPHDPQGRVQETCKPLATAVLPTDLDPFNATNRRSVITAEQEQPNLAHLKSKERADSAKSFPAILEAAFKDHKKSSISSIPSTTVSSNTITSNSARPILPIHSRLAAQARIVAARRQPTVTIQVTDPAGTTRVSNSTSGFMGKLGSNINYDLLPDRARLCTEPFGDAFEDDDDESEGKNAWLTVVRDLAGGDRDLAGRSHFVAAPCGHILHSSKSTLTAEDLF
ncbi:hypothetical protein BU24DRAFT_450861 [Aaosphaeria arxii CBS 175.79]|uniref:F-box domain-containing protein n=1 Tax=Aaosphaeria arxii CBS 175.79 TaxID=1450172 RepID=A0A6A5XSP5_9PLEO|nr:uncharacterized protein BU24DRAFT_450861 [Aaosphaeria arxii CBS 175.79]KAF2016318.1 hypothetical protein BU24DRAFT_450861 [Aaosphaeria arxii CBS 175.79]